MHIDYRPTDRDPFEPEWGVEPDPEHSAEPGGELEDIALDARKAPEAVAAPETTPPPPPSERRRESEDEDESDAEAE